MNIDRSKNDLEQKPIYGLYVPTGSRVTGIAERSAIVGDPRDGYIHVHYEKGGASNVQTFEEKIHHAAGRRAASYPTIAAGAFFDDDLKRVGTVRYDALLRHWVIDELIDEVALVAWSNEPANTGGSAAVKERAAGLLYSKLKPSSFAKIEAARRAGGSVTDTILAIAANQDRNTRNI